MAETFAGYFAERARQPERRTPTARQLECLRYLSHGLDGPQTADAMGLSYETVRAHLSAARLNLAAKNTTHAVAIALRLCLIR